VLWGGAKDVGRNKTSCGLKHVQAFVKKSCHTCVILLSVPCRYDLDMIACVNNEVKVFVRKLWKEMKVVVHTELVYMGLYGNLFTKHGLHMNTKRKGMAGKKTVS
jgi:hypothetical protein